MKAAGLIQHGFEAPVRTGLLLLRVTPLSLTDIPVPWQLLLVIELRPLATTCGLLILLYGGDMVRPILVIRPIFFPFLPEILTIWPPGRSGTLIDLLA